MPAVGCLSPSAGFLRITYQFSGAVVKRLIASSYEQGSNDFDFELKRTRESDVDKLVLAGPTQQDTLPFVLSST